MERRRRHEEAKEEGFAQAANQSGKKIQMQKVISEENLRAEMSRTIDVSDSSVDEDFSLSPHESSVDEEKLLSDLHGLLRSDSNLVKIAKKMRIGHLYRKYFSVKSETKMIEQEAVNFINSVKSREQKLKRQSMLTVDKLIEINK